MENSEKNKLMNELRKKNRQSLGKERKDLQDRQAFIRNKIETLQARKDGLIDSLITAGKAGDTETRELIQTEIELIRKDIQELSTEHKNNGEVLECYSKIDKNGKETRNGLLGTLFAGGGTIAAIVLGKESLKRAYQSDMEGTLVNKKCLDVFNRLNPLKMINFKK